MKQCEIVCDLLPLYIEDMTSAGSNEFIQDHLKYCDRCREEYDRMTAPVLSQTDPNEKWKAALQKAAKKQKCRKISMWILLLLLMLCMGGTHLKDYLDNHQVTPQIATPVAPEEVLKLCPMVVPSGEELGFLTSASSLSAFMDTDRIISEAEFAPYIERILPSDARVGCIDSWKHGITIDYFFEGQRIMLSYRDEDGNGTFDTLEKLVNPYYLKGETKPFYSATYSTRTATTQYEVYE